MWTRKDLKDNAKSVLKNIYWKAFWISIVIALAGGSESGGGGGNGGRNSGNGVSNYGSLSPDIAIIAVLVVLGIVFFALALRILFGYPLEVGGRKYFVQSAQYKDNKKCFSFAFAGHNYMGIVVAMLLKGFQNFLWYLLLLIPGIIKQYSYRMVPYILADNPNIGAKRAIKLSNDMTDGHKFNMFVLDLSFIGWYLLGMLALIVGMLFVMPYENATKAELYLVLRKNALDRSMCSYEELLLERPYYGEA